MATEGSTDGAVEERLNTADEIINEMITEEHYHSPGAAAKAATAQVVVLQAVVMELQAIRRELQRLNDREAPEPADGGAERPKVRRTYTPGIR